ncbi:MAG: hypothetical protein CMQ41_16095 [Gammaproteobacteria bacterium]|nr:hypothetical protein [Gammaproteobacteria bacterium]
MALVGPLPGRQPVDGPVENNDVPQRFHRRVPYDFDVDRRNGTVNGPRGGGVGRRVAKPRVESVGVDVGAPRGPGFRQPLGDRTGTRPRSYLVGTGHVGAVPRTVARGTPKRSVGRVADPRTPCMVLVGRQGDGMGGHGLVRRDGGPGQGSGQGVPDQIVGDGGDGVWVLHLDGGGRWTGMPPPFV